MTRTIPVKRMLLQQAAVLPLGALVVPMIWGLFVPGYSSLHQQQSELQLLQHPIAQAMRIFPVVTGLSVLGFAAAMLMKHEGRRMPMTALTAALVGASMIGNGLFVAGNPLHGLYGLTIFCVLVPACFAAELPRRGGDSTATGPSLVIAFATLLYMWLMISGLHPQEFRGLSQRIALIFIFGWYTHASLTMLRLSSTSGAHATANPPIPRPGVA